MRVLYFTDANLLLRRSHVYSILKTSEALSRELGNSVLVLSKNKKISNKQEEILRKHRIKNISILQGGCKTLYSKKREFDVFFYRSPKLVFYAFFARFFLGKKIVVEIHRTPRTFVDVVLWKVAHMTAHKILYITHALHRVYGSDKNKSEVVFCNSLNLNDFSRETQNKEQIKNELGLPKNVKLLVYTGNTIDYQFGALFGALSNISGIHFVIVGATQIDKLEKEIQNKGVKEKVTIIERVNKEVVPLYLLAGDILVVPFVRDEPGAFPVKIYEYMAAGRPILSFSSECIQEVLRDGENAILINPPNVKNWEEGILKILHNPSLAEKISHTAKNESNHYTWEKRGATISRIIKNI